MNCPWHLVEWEILGSVSVIALELVRKFNMRLQFHKIRNVDATLFQTITPYSTSSNSCFWCNMVPLGFQCKVALDKSKKMSQKAFNRQQSRCCSRPVSTANEIHAIACNCSHVFSLFFFWTIDLHSGLTFLMAIIVLLMKATWVSEKCCSARAT